MENNDKNSIRNGKNRIISAYVQDLQAHGFSPLTSNSDLQRAMENFIYDDRDPNSLLDSMMYMSDQLSQAQAKTERQCYRDLIHSLQPRVMQEYENLPAKDRALFCLNVGRQIRSNAHQRMELNFAIQQAPAANKNSLLAEQTRCANRLHTLGTVRTNLEKFQAWETSQNAEQEQGYTR